MKFSIIIPTFNKSQVVKKLLESLEHQTLDSFEVVVVDDGSEDDTQAMIQAAIVSSPLSIRVFQTGLTNEFGMCTAINLGLKNAKGRYSLLLNDDVFLEKECLEEHAKAHSKTQDKHVFIGPRFRCPPYEVGRRVDTNSIQSKFLYRGCNRKQRKDSFFVYRKKRMVSSNVSFKTELGCKIGGYNECIKNFSSAADREFYHRLEQSGVRVLFCPTAQAFSPSASYGEYKKTLWWTSNEGAMRNGLSVNEWKRKQYRHRPAAEKEGIQNPPPPIKNPYLDQQI